MKSKCIGSQTQPIPLQERTCLLRLQLQPLELFAQHGWRVMEHVRHRLSSALRLLQSFPGYLDNEFVVTYSPFDTRDDPDVVLALVLQLLDNRELTGDLELVIGVKPHLRHVDVVQFGCNEVLHCVHVLFVVVGNMPRSRPSAHELAVLALPG